MHPAFPTSLTHCPVCKKAAPLAAESIHCPRCGCDLSKPAAAHAAARHHTIAAATSLRTRDYSDALDHANYAWTLARLSAIPPIACLASLLSQNFTELTIWRGRINQ